MAVRRENKVLARVDVELVVRNRFLTTFLCGLYDPPSVTAISVDNVAIRYILSPAIQVSDDDRLAPVICFPS